MADSKQSTSRFTIIFAGGTLLSRIFGLLRDIVIGMYLPDVSRDAFLFAFKLPNMLRDMLGEGAANAAFVPVLTEVREREGEGAFRELIASALSMMLIVFGLLTILGVFLMPWVPILLDSVRSLTHAPPKESTQLLSTVRLMQWTFPYLFLIGMAVFAMGPLFVLRHYATPSWSPVLLNLALIGSCLALHNVFPDPAWALVTGVWIGGLAQWVVMFAAMKRHTGVLWPSFKFRHPGLVQIVWLLLPVIVGQATGEVNKLVDSFFAYSLAEGTVSSLFYANRLVQLPLSIFGIAVAVAILPGLSQLAVRQDEEGMRAMLLSGFRRTLFLIAPAVVLLLVLGHPMMVLLFQRGHFDAALATRAATALSYYSLGLLSFAWVKVAVQGFYAIQNTKTPVIVASACMFLNILLNCVLVGVLGYRGLALSTSISFSLNFILLYALLGARFGFIWDATVPAFLCRIVLALFFMGGILYGSSLYLGPIEETTSFLQRLGKVLIPAIAGGGVYLLLCKAMRIPELDHFLAVFQRRRA